MFYAILFWSYTLYITYLTISTKSKSIIMPWELQSLDHVFVILFSVFLSFLLSGF
jgi:hypothetical protein